MQVFVLTFHDVYESGEPIGAFLSVAKAMNSHEAEKALPKASRGEWVADPAGIYTSGSKTRDHRNASTHVLVITPFEVQ